MGTWAIRIGLVMGLGLCGAASAEPVRVSLAAAGRAMQAVVISDTASERTRQAAAELAEYLGRICGTRFDVRTGDGSTGLAIGAAADFAGIRLGMTFDPRDPFRRDDYLLRSHQGGVYILGATDGAAHLAVWDLLHRLGYRLYFPTDTWEIVPERRALDVAIDTFERPDYVSRRAPRGAPWSDDALWDRWRLRNRVASSFVLNTGHAYEGIVRANAQAFKAHPEYCALVDGERYDPERGNVKFCISNPNLRRLVVDWAARQMREHPEQDSLSMDPSDGGNWCACDPCAAMGSVSDRVVTLANEVAEAINALGIGPRYVGIYAYSQHSPPPSVKVHPNVVVSVATSFIRGGYSVEELVEGWRARGAVLGIRDYHDVFTWSHDVPRKARGGNLEYLTRTIRYFHAQGARFMNSENADSWGANGLGYWITPRLLWDVEQSDRVDELVGGFIDHAFGSAREPMGRFYQLLNRDHDTLRSSEDLVGRMYRCLDEARQLTDDAKVRRRLDDLILYTRYLELYYAYRQADGAARQRSFEQVWRHAYRMRDRMMVSARAICDRDRAYRDSSVKVPEQARWDVPEDENPWKSGESFGDHEIVDLLAAGIEANEPTVLDFVAVKYSEDLVPASRLNLPGVKRGGFDSRFRGRQTFFTWLPEGRRRLELTVAGGLIPHYRDRGNVQFALYADEDPTLEPVDEDRSVAPDGEPHTIVLTTRHKGLHRLQWNDGKDMTRVIFPDDLPLTVRSTLEDPMRLTGRWDLYFYVPRGTTVVGGYSTGTQGRLLDGSGKAVFDFSEMQAAGYFSVPAPAGQDGKLWRFEDADGARLLMTVPPYLAPSGEQLLLPREVVEADAGR